MTTSTVDKLNYLNETKNEIKAAIRRKGQTVLDSDSFRSYAEKIDNITTGGGDTVTATNNTESAISDGDKVWINKSGNEYELIEPKTSLNPMFGFFTSAILSIDKINKSITGFDTSRYCYVGQTMDFSHSWELNMSFQTGSDISVNQFLYAGDGTTQANMNSSGIVVWLNAGEKVIQADFMYNNGISDIGHMSVIPASAMSTYTTYYIKIGWTGTEYYGKYSLDGTVWVENTERITSQTQISQDVNVIRLGQMGWITSMFFRGKIFMDKTYLTSGDSIQWQMYSDGANNLGSDMLTGIAAENIAVSGTGDVYIGNVIEPTISSLSITPSTSAQTFNSSSVDGYKPITVNAVTSSIDPNIVAGNIKNGVTILGVTGSYEGSSSTNVDVKFDFGPNIPLSNNTHYLIHDGIYAYTTDIDMLNPLDLTNGYVRQFTDTGNWEVDISDNTISSVAQEGSLVAINFTDTNIVILIEITYTTNCGFSNFLIGTDWSLDWGSEPIWTKPYASTTQTYYVLAYLTKGKNSVGLNFGQTDSSIAGSVKISKIHKFCLVTNNS